MMLELIINMPVRNGAVTHRIVCQHPAKSLQEFTMELQQTDFIIVEEFYPKKDTTVYVNHGPISLNHRIIGKIKEWDIDKWTTKTS
jgi:hypothetical protein